MNMSNECKIHELFHALLNIFLISVVAADCAALYLAGVNVSGIYLLQPDPSDNRTRFRALCDMDTEGGGWTVIQVIQK